MKCERPPFLIVRPLGNELPPRDHAGSRIEALRVILETEHLDGADRLWILNRVWHQSLRQEYLKLLESHGERSVELPFSPEEYLKAPDRAAKKIQVMGLNAARSFGRRLGVEQGYEYIVSLDGDCTIFPLQWSKICRDISEEEQRSDPRRYFSLPMIRCTSSEVRQHRAPERPFGEPSLIFHRTATEDYNPALSFADGNRQELLYRLGHRREPERQHEIHPGAKTRVTGLVAHVATGPWEAEMSYHVRCRLREEATDLIFREIDQALSRST